MLTQLLSCNKALVSTGITEIPKLVEASTVGKVLLSPFRVFCDMIAAERVFPDFLTSAGIARMMIAGLVIAIFKLDADYAETAIRVRQLDAMLQYLLLILAMGLAAGFTAVVYLVSRSVILAAIAAATALAGECVLGLLLVWTAYVRFDVAEHLT